MGILFGIYKLYYKLLYMYSHREVTKSSYHNMVDNGPRTVQLNCTLLQHFIDIIWTQIRDIYYLEFIHTKDSGYYHNGWCSC